MYESGPEITTVGAGISVWERTWDTMRQLGLYEELAQQAVRDQKAKDVGSASNGSGEGGMSTFSTIAFLSRATHASEA